MIKYIQVLAKINLTLHNIPGLIVEYCDKPDNFCFDKVEVAISFKLIT